MILAGGRRNVRLVFEADNMREHRGLESKAERPKP
jgi:hypothetical protein